eukprot:gene12100-15212_t
MAKTEGQAPGAPDGAILTFVSKRLRAARKKLNRITGGSPSASSPVVVLRDYVTNTAKRLWDNPQVVAIVEELEKVYSGLKDVVADELAAVEEKHARLVEEITASRVAEFVAEFKEARIAELSEAAFDVAEIKAEAQVAEEASVVSNSASDDDEAASSADADAEDVQEADESVEDSGAPSTESAPPLIAVDPSLAADQVERLIKLIYFAQSRPLDDSDLCLLAAFGRILMLRVPGEVLNHKDTLELHSQKAILFLSGDGNETIQELGVTVAFLRERLDRLLSSPFVTVLPQVTPWSDVPHLNQAQHMIHPPSYMPSLLDVASHPAGMQPPPHLSPALVELIAPQPSAPPMPTVSGVRSSSDVDKAATEAAASQPPSNTFHVSAPPFFPSAAPFLPSAPPFLPSAPSFYPSARTNPSPPLPSAIPPFSSQPQPKLPNSLEDAPTAAPPPGLLPPGRVPFPPVPAQNRSNGTQGVAVSGPQGSGMMPVPNHAPAAAPAGAPSFPVIGPLSHMFSMGSQENLHHQPPQQQEQQEQGGLEASRAVGGRDGSSGAGTKPPVFSRGGGGGGVEVKRGAGDGNGNKGRSGDGVSGSKPAPGAATSAAPGAKPPGGAQGGGGGKPGGAGGQGSQPRSGSGLLGMRAGVASPRPGLPGTKAGVAEEVAEGVAEGKLLSHHNP